MAELDQREPSSAASVRCSACAWPTPAKRFAASTLYAATPDAYDHTDVAMASIFARHAAAALSVAQDYRGLHSALLSRQIIGAAQGTLISATACPWTRH